MNDSEAKLLLLLIGGFVGGCFLFWRGFRLLHKKRTIENIPTSKIRSVAIGLCEVVGKALKATDTALESPFSRTPCVFYHYLVQELRSTGKRSSWLTIAEDQSIIPFYLRDDTGKILINPREADLDLKKDHRNQLGIWGTDNREQLEAGLHAIGLQTKSFLGLNKRIRVEESYILENDETYIMGTAQSNPTVKGSANGVDNLFIGKSKGQYFFISDESEKSLLGGLALQSYGGILGGPILTIGCLFGMIYYFLT